MVRQNLTEKVKELENENKQLKKEIEELNEKLKMLKIEKGGKKKEPKKCKEAKMFFIMDLYAKEEKPKINFMKYLHSEEINQKWNNIRNDQKQEYIEKERKDKERYEEEIKKMDEKNK